MSECLPRQVFLLQYRAVGQPTLDWNLPNSESKYTFPLGESYSCYFVTVAESRFKTLVTDFELSDERNVTQGHLAKEQGRVRVGLREGERIRMLSFIRQLKWALDKGEGRICRKLGPCPLVK